MFLKINIDAAFTHFCLIHFQFIAFAGDVVAVLQLEFVTMQRANDLAAAVDEAIAKICTAMRTCAFAGEEIAGKFYEAKMVIINLDAANAFVIETQRTFRICDLVPHQKKYSAL